MPLTKYFLVVGILATVSCSTSRDAVIVAMREACIGEVLSEEMREIRNAVLADITEELMIPAPQRAVLLRASALPAGVKPVITERLTTILGDAQSELLLAANATQRCLENAPNELAILQTATVDPSEFWTRFRRDNPHLSGFVVVTTPIFAQGSTDSAFALVDYHCGEQCGTMWLVVARKKDGHWEADTHDILAQY